MKTLFIIILTFSVNAFGLDLLEVRKANTTFSANTNPLRVGVPSTNINELLKRSQESARIRLLEVSGAGKFGASEVFLNNGDRSLIYSNSRRILNLNNVDSIMLNNGSYLDSDSIQDLLKFKGTIDIGSGLDGSIYAVGGDGSDSGGS